MNEAGAVNCRAEKEKRCPYCNKLLFKIRAAELKECASEQGRQYPKIRAEMRENCGAVIDILCCRCKKIVSLLVL